MMEREQKKTLPVRAKRFLSMAQKVKWDQKQDGGERATLGEDLISVL